MKRARHLPGEESASYTLPLATAYRMLFGHRPHVLRPGHNVLVWGASGGLGSMAVQLCATSGAHALGGRPPAHPVPAGGPSGGLGSMAVQLCATSGANAIGVVSEEDKRDFVMQLG